MSNSSPLPPRLAQMLELLLTAKSEKEIAAALKLSRHTVHSRIREVYSHFGVRSRLELLAMKLREKSGEE